MAALSVHTTTFPARASHTQDEAIRSHVAGIIRKLINLQTGSQSGDKTASH